MGHSSFAAAGKPNSTITGNGPLGSSNNVNVNSSLPFYGLSGVLEVVTTDTLPDVSISRNAGTVNEGQDVVLTLTRSDTTAGNGEALSVTVDVTASARIASEATKTSFGGQELDQDTTWPPTGYTGDPSGSLIGPSLHKRFEVEIPADSATGTLTFTTRDNSIYQGRGVFVAGIVPDPEDYLVPRSGWTTVDVADTEHPEIQLELISSDAVAIAGMTNSYRMEEGKSFTARLSITSGWPATDSLFIRHSRTWQSGWFAVWGDQGTSGTTFPGIRLGNIYMVALSVEEKLPETRPSPRFGSIPMGVPWITRSMRGSQTA